MSGLSIETRVANGAAWLDEKRPGWERMINLGDLLMDDPDWCICGQAQAWHIDDMGCVDAAARGFLHQTRWVEDEYAELDEAWRSLIKERFSSGTLSDG